MQYLEPLFELPDEIRKCIYTSNAVESVNSVYKVLYLRIRELKEKWKRPIKNWKIIQSQITDLFGERYTKYLKI